MLDWLAVGQVEEDLECCINCLGEHHPNKTAVALQVGVDVSSKGSGWLGAVAWVACSFLVLAEEGQVRADLEECHHFEVA